MKLTFPIYYTKTTKKKTKTFLVGLNWYRNAHFYESNEVKEYYHWLVRSQVKKQRFTKIKLKYTLYCKRNNVDGTNVRSVVEKFILDGLVECGVIPNDTIEYVMGDSAEYFKDVDNPRCDVEIIEVE